MANEQPDQLLVTSESLIKLEVDQEITNKVKQSLGEVKNLAIKEAWKILQVVIAGVIQIIEKVGIDLSNPDKKALAMNIIGNFYDTVFKTVDLPLVPKFLQPIIQRQIRAVLMLLVDASIDSMVTIFKNTGVFLKQKYV